MISIAIQHAVWRPERREALRPMLVELLANAIAHPFIGLTITDEKPARMAWSEFKTHLALRQWRWALEQPDCSHHLFMSDDLHLAPGFLPILNAMVEADPDRIIGLLGNHPKAVDMSAHHSAYRCNSWVVGPAYLMPRAQLEMFLRWYEGLPDTEEPQCRRWFNDDSAINEWNTKHGRGESWHPLPTIIEHRHDVESTVGHGDCFSRERVSWREMREVQHHEDGHTWFSRPASFDLEAMKSADYWRDNGPMLTVGE